MTDTKNTVSDELLPCPFCGSPGKLIDTVMGNWTKDGYGPNGSRVVCSVSTCSGIGSVAYGENQTPDAIAAWNLRASIPGGVGVKGLEWLDHVSDGKYAPSIFGNYFAYADGSWSDPQHHHRWSKGDLNSAKAAAQADYVRRILSSLDLSPAEGEPVAWQIVLPNRHEGSIFTDHEAAVGIASGFKTAVVRPLYAAPSNPVVSDKPQVLGYVNVYEDEHGEIELGSTDLDAGLHSEWDGLASAFMKYRGRAEVRLVAPALSVKPQSGGDKP